MEQLRIKDPEYLARARPVLNDAARVIVDALVAHGFSVEEVVDEPYEGVVPGIDPETREMVLVPSGLAGIDSHAFGMTKDGIDLSLGVNITP